MTLFLSVRAQRFVSLQEVPTRRRGDAELDYNRDPSTPREKRKQNLSRETECFDSSSPRLRVSACKPRFAALAGILLAVLTTSPACADEFDKAARLPESQLDDMRGGFILQDGVSIGLGAIVRTTVDGALALETQLVWQQEGAVITQQLGAGIMPSDGAITKTVTLPAGSPAFVLCLKAKPPSFTASPTAPFRTSCSTPPPAAPSAKTPK
jgi:hypothetical protein